MNDRRWPYAIILLLLPPALLVHLGYMPLIDDEGIRSLVALEMGWSGNWVAPTLHGDYYYNKPPLWNWILLAFVELTGQQSEWVMRLPTVLCLLGFGATIYYYGRRYLRPDIAFLNALAFITCGRVLFWDSMLALIDTCFSWAMFVLLMVVYHEFERRRWLRLFVFSYVLTAIGFMLKGLPAVVFQGITLLVYFTYRREFKRLFSVAHILSGLLAVVLVGSYYLLYNEYNSLEAVFTTLFSESSKRTVVRFGVAETLLHLVTFPFELIYHFLPWSLVALYFIRRDARQLIQAHTFMSYLVLVFVANLVPYWTSPEVYPRYLLMLVPLLFTLGFYAHQQLLPLGVWAYRALQLCLLVFALVLSLAWLAPLLSIRLQVVYGAIPISIALLLGSLGLSWQAWRQPEQRWLWVMAVMLLFRIGFNWYVLPDRLANDYGELCRQSSIAVGQRWAGKPLYIYHHTLMQPTNSYYLERSYGGIIRRKVDHFSLSDYYVVHKAQFPKTQFEVLDSFQVRHGQFTYYVAQLRDTLPPAEVWVPGESLTPLPEPNTINGK